MKKMIKLLLLILWLFIIFMLSHFDGSKSTSQSDIIVKSLYKFTYIDKHALVIIVRKLAHVFEYFVLCILIYTNINEYKPKHVFKLSIILSLLYATFDEFHQLFINKRSGKIEDIIIDFIGIILGYITIKHFNKNKLKST